MFDESTLKRRGFTLIELIVAVIIIGVLVALLLPAVQQPRGHARRGYCRNSLKQIGLALHNYHNAYGSLPPAYTVDEDGNRLHSWRTLILPFLDQAPLYEQMDLTKPWDDPVNAVALETSIITYLCPGSDIPQNHTTYVGMVGEERAFAPTEGRTFQEFRDGTSNTVIVAETLKGAAIHWMSPYDDQFDVLNSLNLDAETYHKAGIHILFADGRAWFLSAKMDKKTRNAISTIAGNDNDLISEDL